MSLYGWGSNIYNQLTHANLLHCVSIPLKCSVENIFEDDSIGSKLVITCAWSNIYLGKGKVLLCRGYGTHCKSGFIFEIQDGAIVDMAVSWLYLCVACTNGYCLLWKHGEFTDGPMCKVVLHEEKELHTYEIKNVAFCGEKLVILTAAGRLLTVTDFEKKPEHFQMPSNEEVCQICSGKEHTVLRTIFGNVYTFGSGSRGQLGHGSTEEEKQPRLVVALEGIRIIDIAAGGWHSLAISDIGDIYVWGWNESGQLGFPTLTGNSTFSEKCDIGKDFSTSYNQNTDSNIVPVSDVNSSESGANIQPKDSNIKYFKDVCQNEELFKQQINAFEETEQKRHPGSSEQNEKPSRRMSGLFQSIPTVLDCPMIPEDIVFVQVSCGSRHSAAVTDGGTLYVWGNSEHGQLGHGQNCDGSSTPKAVHFFTNLNVKHVICGNWNTLAIMDKNSSGSECSS